MASSAAVAKAGYKEPQRSHRKTHVRTEAHIIQVRNVKGHPYVYEKLNSQGLWETISRKDIEWLLDKGFHIFWNPETPKRLLTNMFYN